MSKAEPPFVVAIDGPAGAGKSTAARALAVRLGYTFLDTGAIYRAVALAAQKQGIDWGNAPAVGVLATALDIGFVPDGEKNRVFIDSQDVTEEIRLPDISEGASRVSAHPEVRAALLALQRRLGAMGKVVAEGRDTGTVIFPDARAKFFLTAPPRERARRRTKELVAKGRPADEDEVLREMEVRDRRDSTRLVAPLKKAEDAVEIDSQDMTPDQVVDRMVSLVRARGG